MLKLPYSIFPAHALEKSSRKFLWIGESLQDFFPFLKINLKRAKIGFSLKEYLSMCFFSSSILFVFLLVFLNITFFVADIENFYLVATVIALVLTLFVFIQQVSYPKMYANRRIKDIERNLMDALQNMLVQLNSGVPLFDILVNLSKNNYGEISKEFLVVVKEINTGKSQIEALEEVASLNPSLFFRRALWQIINGIKSGADLSQVIKEIINLLSEEQVLQIQRYGSQLNPLAMFYMLLVVIVPSLGMTFLIILSSFISGTSPLIVQMMFWGMFAGVAFFQIMFLGIIKSRRPNLLG